MDPTTQSPIARLLGSTKFLVCLLAIVAVTVLSALGRFEGQQAIDFIKWVVITWTASQAVQSSAEKLVGAYSQRTQVAASLPPPPAGVNNILGDK
jgi:hypothetical protein